MRIGFGILVFLMSGCSTIGLRKIQSSGVVGCASSEIEILDEVPSGAPTWTAICKGMRFYCSASSGVFGQPSQISCKEELK